MRVITKDYFSLVKWVAHFYFRLSMFILMYFKLFLRQNLTDSVPKAVHCFLIDASKRSLLPALIQDAYTPSVTAMFEMESAAVTEDHKRHARICQQLLEIEGEISSLTREVHENVV